MTPVYFIVLKTPTFHAIIWTNQHPEMKLLFLLHIDFTALGTTDLNQGKIFHLQVSTQFVPIQTEYL